FPTGNCSQSGQQEFMGDIVECALDVRIHDPFLPFVWSSQFVDFPDGVMTTAPRTEPVAAALKPCFPGGFQRILHHRLNAPVNHHRDTEWTQFSIGLRDVDATHWLRSPGLVVTQQVHQPSPVASGVLMTTLSTPG